MAHRSRRHREADRFGTPTRLADIIAATPAGDWLASAPVAAAIRAGLFAADAVTKAAAQVRRDVATATVIAADNVMAYYAETPKCDWDYDADFPCVAPPFDTFLVEMRRPGRFVWDGGERTDLRGILPDVVGCLFWAIPAAELDHEMPVSDADDGSIVHQRFDAARWFLACHFVCATGGRPMLMGAGNHLAVDAAGAILGGPYTTLQGIPEMTGVRRDDVARGYDFYFVPALLALCFLHCKNVTMTDVAPDARFNRERKKSGRPPLVRFKTINIEPARRVLRAAGGADAVGIKTALHIVRGHFMNYTADKPLFGRPGAVGRFWSPQHARGTADAGVVVADYNVKPPRPGGHQP